jgi:hypothetical protein
MKTFFVELVFNNKDKFIDHNRYLGGIVSAEDEDKAEMIVMKHYLPYYTGGDKGTFHVQCNWEVKIPTREIIEAHWKKASMSELAIPINAPGYEIKTIGYRYFRPDTTKKEVMRNWDYCHITWSNPCVYFDPKKDGYVVAIQSYMSMPVELVFFKGLTRNTYMKAKKFVKDNTFKGTHFREL